MDHSFSSRIADSRRLPVWKRIMRWTLAAIFFAIGVLSFGYSFNIILIHDEPLAGGVVMGCSVVTLYLSARFAE